MNSFSFKAIDKAFQKVRRREKLLLNAVNELEKIVYSEFDEMKAEALSRPLKIKEIALLLEVSKPTVYNRGANTCRTYAELWRWTKKHMPDNLKKLEQNFQRMITS